MNAVLEISSKAVIHNYTFIKSKLHLSTKIIAVVKASGYGSDAVILAKILQNEKVTYFAVAYAEEGIVLRQKGITTPIIVLHPQKDNLPLIVQHQLEPSLYSVDILDAFLQLLKKKSLTNYPVHLKFNTGLNRLGFYPTKVNEIINLIRKEKKIKVISVFSHLAESDEAIKKDFTLKQIEIFTQLKNKINTLLDKKPLYHLLNTSGIINYPKAQFDMVRLGIGLLGFDNAKNISLQNVLTLKSFVSQIHTLHKGDSVGYNRAFICTQNMKIATVSIGHADGISRQFGNGFGSVYINNQPTKIIGNVCMDMLMIDVSNIRCVVGDAVVFFNSQETIQTMAKNINTIPYELITMLSQRITRIVVQ